jgi:superfamily II DNA/RNA helicase
MDIIVSTPGQIAMILQMHQCSTRILSLEWIAAVVFDEVDILLLDLSFAPQLETIGQAVSAAVTAKETTLTMVSKSNDSSSNNNNKSWGWQQHCSKVATAKTGQQWYNRY